jgi:CHAD domain-containing protein
MAFRIKPDESVARSVRRIARAQIVKALADLDRRDETGVEIAIHSARKRFKRLRALVRLSRGGLGKELSARENARFRDAGRPLSELRDADVLLQTLDRLVERYGDDGQADAIGQAREALVHRKQAVARQVLDHENTLAHVSQILRDARDDVKRWEIDRDGLDVLSAGIQRIYKLGLRMLHEARESPTDEPLHEWRKRVKDLWYALEFLKPVRPAFTESRSEMASKLSDALGDDHDLAVLRMAISDSAPAILTMIDDRRAKLRREAFDLGEAIFNESPKDFARRFRAYWRAWRAEFDAARFDLPSD